MAGSWQHITTRTGRFAGTDYYGGQVENLGDAQEAFEECFGMVWWLAQQLAIARDGPAPARKEILAVIREAEDNYPAGVALGGVRGADGA
jgi:hypothetical protein